MDKQHAGENILTGYNDFQLSVQLLMPDGVLHENDLKAVTVCGLHLNHESVQFSTDIDGFGLLAIEHLSCIPACDS